MSQRNLNFPAIGFNFTEQKLPGGLTLGQAARRVRTELYQMSQTQYAAFIGLSAKTLRDIEKGNTDPKLSVLSKVFRPTGMNIIAQAK
jgi:DNA-binding XRE family transcriptional regulator